MMDGQKNIKLCTKLALFTRLYRDAQSTKYKIHGVKNVEITGGWRELHSQELHDLHSMEQSTSQEASIFSTSQEIPSIYGTHKFTTY